MTAPKVFISYSWTSHGHQLKVKQWAEQLMADGVDVVLDLFDLKEGDDKYAFMERMVTDSSVTHVLMMCDKAYAEKADARKAGVGTESQIISREVYEKVKQSKFIPIFCELDDKGEPFLPTFLKSRIGINFSTDAAANENWEQLVRLLHGKPLHVKPSLGRPPSYLREESVPASPAIAKFSALKQAILQGKPAVDIYRQDFLDVCIEYPDSLRVRKQPEGNVAEMVASTCGKLKPIRNHIVDWILLEARAAPSEKSTEALIEFLERLRELKLRPPQLTTNYSERWFEAHSLFVNETFLYIVAALLKTGSFGILHEVFSSSYLLPTSEMYGAEKFQNFGCFYGESEALQSIWAPENQQLLSPAGELIKRQADRTDIPLSSVIEAELLVLLMSFITPKVRWFPQTLYYGSHYGNYPFFVRAAQHRHFKKLALITGIDSGDQLREKVREGFERRQVDRWQVSRDGIDPWELMNLDKLDTLT